MSSSFRQRQVRLYANTFPTSYADESGRGLRDSNLSPAHLQRLPAISLRALRLIV
jgi:hypothetical protein